MSFATTQGEKTAMETSRREGGQRKGRPPVYPREARDAKPDRREQAEIEQEASGEECDAAAAIAPQVTPGHGARASAGR